MSSILTNSSSMIALQTLRNTNSSLSGIQSQISTGKKIASSSDNAAIWSVAKVMESDIAGFKGISDSLALGSSTLSVAKNAAETVQSLLEQMKSHIVSAQNENVQRDKIQTEITALAKQISGTVAAAQFSGLNMVSGQDDVKFLASLDRSTAGVSASDITVARQDLSTTQGSQGSTAVAAANVNMTAPAGSVSNASTSVLITAAAIALNGASEIYINGSVVRIPGATAAPATTNVLAANSFVTEINKLGLEGITAVLGGTAGTFTISNANATKDVDIRIMSGATAAATAAGYTTTGSNVTLNKTAKAVVMGTAAVVAGQSYNLTLGTSNFSYVARKGDSMDDVANGLKIAIDAGKIPGLETSVTQNATSKQWELNLSTSSATPIAAVSASATTGGKATGGLFGLDKIDVTTTEGARAALANIETFINRAIDSAAQFGSAQTRVDTQAKFVKSLSDSLTDGVGSLVDANMEEASAALQALQVKQQLGIQALTIANQAPQNLLSLFR